MINEYDYKVLRGLMNEIASKIDGHVFFKFEHNVSSDDSDYPGHSFNIYIHGEDHRWREDFHDMVDLIKWMNKLIIRLNRKPNQMMQSQNLAAETIPNE